MPGKVKDLRGRKFGRLLVISEEGIIDKHAHWLCSCDCGAQVIVRGTKLSNGERTSCGCGRKDPDVRRAARMVTPAKRRHEIAKLGGVQMKKKAKAAKKQK